MNSFNSNLIDKIKTVNSHLCVGLDISPEALGSNIDHPDILMQHTKKVIDATRDLAVAYKPNLAFFERWGSAGFQWLEEMLDYIGSKHIVIGDAKRGDIGNTARQYAESLFQHFDFDAVTINPYMGRDAIEPFTANPNKGVFILCRTSNPSAYDLQNQKVNGKYLFELVAEMAVDINSRDNIGLVVGATATKEIELIRNKAPGLPFLIPGIGAQGGELEASFRAGNTNGIALINVSRGICFAGDQTEKAIRNTARNYVRQMREFNCDV